jgi:hypothetical protein
MIHGRKGQRRINSRRKKRESLLTLSSEEREKSLSDRIAAVESRVDELGALESSQWNSVVRQVQHAIEDIGKDQRKRMDDTELLAYRNDIVSWLERHWLTIVVPIQLRNAQQISAVLESIAQPRDIRPRWQMTVVDHVPELLDFLQSDKFRRKPPQKTVLNALQLVHSKQRDRAANRLPPRQIANAMAGVPKLKWRTSLDKCSKQPCSFEVGHEAAAYYRQVCVTATRGVER